MKTKEMLPLLQWKCFFHLWELINIVLLWLNHWESTFFPVLPQRAVELLSSAALSPPQPPPSLLLRGTLPKEAFDLNSLDYPTVPIASSPSFISSFCLCLPAVFLVLSCDPFPLSHLTPCPFPGSSSKPAPSGQFLTIEAERLFRYFFCPPAHTQNKNKKMPAVTSALNFVLIFTHSLSTLVQHFLCSKLPDVSLVFLRLYLYVPDTLFILLCQTEATNPPSPSRCSPPVAHNNRKQAELLYINSGGRQRGK